MKADIIISSGNGFNSGFIRDLYLVDINEVEFINDPVYAAEDGYQHVIKNDGIGLRDGSTIYQMKFNSRSCTFSDSQSSGTDIFFQVSINWDFPKARAEVNDFLFKNRFRRWLAVFKDFNGAIYCSGDIENGLFLTSTRSIADQNMTTVQLAGKSWHSVWNLESIEIFSFVDMPFSSDFSYDFKS